MTNTAQQTTMSQAKRASVLMFSEGINEVYPLATGAAVLNCTVSGLALSTHECRVISSDQPKNK